MILEKICVFILEVYILLWVNMYNNFVIFIIELEGIVIFI